MPTSPPALLACLAQDRRRALAGGFDLPEQCQGAALFSDISGFTALTEALTQQSGPRRGVDELARRINAVLQVLIDEVERWDGSVIAFAGDGMTCWFDESSRAAGPAAHRALQCASAMQRAMLRFPELSIKIGVSAGQAQRLVVGEPGIQRIDLLTGATVARAVVAQNLAEAGEVIVDEAVARALGSAGLGAPRRAESGEAFRALLPGSTSPEAERPGARADAGTAIDIERLRPWLLPFVLERETASGGLFATDLRPATALFVRVAVGVGVPADGEPAEQRQLSELVCRVQRTLQQHGGVLLEVSVDALGTCFYGSFGAAQVHEDDPQRALRCALALAGALAEAQIGLASGTLCVGGYGGAGRRSFGAIGDAVNAAARMMGLARPGEVLMAGRVRQPLGDEEFTFEARPPIAVKGKAEPIPVFAATGVQRRRSIRLQEPLATLPMVGREAETALIGAAIAAALAGRGQVLRIVGEAGMGKSRLLAEGIRIARRAGLIGYGGACRLDGLRTPYGVWQGIWTAFFDIDPALPQRRQRQAAQAALQLHAPEQGEAWPLLGAVLGQDWPDTALTAALDPKDRKLLLHALLLRCLQAAAVEAAQDGMGLLLVLEDLHAADPLSLALLADLTRGIDALPLLVLTAERPAETATDPLSTLAHAATLELRGLAAGDVEPIVRAKLAQHFPERVGPVPRELLERIAARAQGNPFYVEELLDYLHDRGLDPRQPEAVQSLELPSSLHSLVLSRMDRLRTAQQNELKAASVIGREFAVSELQGYCPSLGTAERVAADLVELGRLGFTPAVPDRPDPGHVFRHLVTQEVAYESIGLDTRAQLHGQYARHLERIQPDGPPDSPHLAPLLAHHYERAERALGRDKACHYLRLAGVQAAARFANHEALAHFEKVLQWLPSDAATTRFDVLVQRQALHELLGQHAPQRADLDELARLAAVLPEAAVRGATVALLRAKLEIQLGHYAAGRAEALAALTGLDGQAEDAATNALRLDAMLQEARAMVYSGEAATAMPLLHRALALACEQGLVAEQEVALSNIGHAHWHLGEFEQAERWFGDALVLARRGGSLRSQLKLLNSLGIVSKSRSRFTEAAPRYEEALQIARRIGDRSGEAMLMLNLGSACLAAGRLHEAGQYGEQAARFFAQADETAPHGTALALCGEVQRELGRYASALALSEQALALLRRSGSRPHEALVLENLGLIEAAAGRSEAGQARLQASVQLAREIGSAAREASALVHLAQLQVARGEWGAAGESLARAERLAESLGSEDLRFELDTTQAQLSLCREETRAVRHLERLLPRLLGDPEPGVPGLPLSAYAIAWRVLQACGDPRAAALLARGRRELAERAERIPDAEARRSFLEVAEHRAICAG